jgi:hypothetical protein
MPSAEKTGELIKRRGRSSGSLNLSDFIVQILKEKNKPLTSEQMIKEYKKRYKIDLAGSKNTMASLNQSLFRLRAKQNLITSTRRKGKRGNLYSLVAKTAVPKAKEKPKKEKRRVNPPAELPSGSKYNWPQFIVDTLTKSKRILPLNEFVRGALVHYQIPPTDKKSTYGKISPVLTQMSKNKDRIRSVKKEGSSKRFYVLNEWFNDKNELITLFQ